VDRWLEDSGFSFDCEEVGAIDVVDPSAIRKAETLPLVDIEDEAAVESVDAVLAVYPRRLSFNNEGFRAFERRRRETGRTARPMAQIFGRGMPGLVLGGRLEASP
jgi:hypothetical protein